MKILTLLRHAKSAWDDPIERDFDRPLNTRGRKAARTIGREMRVLGLRFDKVAASPAVRVIETLEEVASGYGASLAEEYDPRLYLAPLSTLLEIVHETDDEVERLLIVGHNPGLENLALFLTGAQQDGLREALERKYPTATLTEIALPVTHWRDTERGLGSLTRFIRPRDLDPALGPDF